MKFPWQKPDRKDQLIETYRQAGAACAFPCELERWNAAADI